MASTGRRICGDVFWLHHPTSQILGIPDSERSWKSPHCRPSLCLLSLVYCLRSPVSWFSPPTSCLLSPISCLPLPLTPVLYHPFPLFTPLPLKHHYSRLGGGGEGEGWAWPSGGVRLSTWRKCVAALKQVLTVWYLTTQNKFYWRVWKNMTQDMKQYGAEKGTKKLRWRIKNNMPVTRDASLNEA